MTRILLFAVRPAPLGAAVALCCAALLAGLAGCGAEPEIERSPVAASGEAPAAGDAASPEGSRDLGTLALRGATSYDGEAAVACGPVAASGGHADGQEAEAVGRPEAVPAEDPAGEEHADPQGEGRTFEVTLTAVEAPGLAVTLRLPDAGRGPRAPFVVATVGEDGAYRESAGTAEVALEDGSLLTRSAATDYLSGRFTGRYQGEAGAGEVEGRFERCFYFD